MTIDLRSADDWFILKRPVRIRTARIAAAFLRVGMLLIIAEAVFFEYFASLAHSSFSTRQVLGYHVFLSELWFIGVGNLLVFLIAGERGFSLPRRMLNDSKPILMILGVYSLWFVYGALAGNPWALQEFREMVFGALGLPPMLLLSSMVGAKQLLRSLVLPGVVALLFAATVASQDLTSFMLGSYFAGFFVLTLLYRTYWAIFGLGLAALPILVSFSKPAVTLFVFAVAVSFGVAGYLNQRSANWILSRFKIKILLVGAGILLGLALTVFLINLWTGGAIEAIVRWYFLKERITAGGEIVQGDMSGGRLAIWRSAIESWTGRPLVGYGLGAEVVAYSTGWVTKVQFHNYLVQALHNTGLAGFVMIVGGWFIWLRRSFRKVRRVTETDEKIVLGSMLVFVCSMLFFGLYGHAFSRPPTTQLFWLCVAFLSVCEVRNRVGQ